ncbi:MAG: outer membrane lipoprotein LolB [Proteobacteria bacterium]|nr:outer membrane lipoprotein LolB [Pseudomonadota bacterium]
MNPCARAFALLAVLALAACAELQRAGPQEDVEFELAGRIAVRYREEAASGNVAWRHSRDSDELLITSPVGSAVARLVRNGTGYVLTTADQREIRAGDAEALTEQALGFRLPVAGLSDWVRARPVAGQPSVVVRDAEGRPASLEQGGWRIEYQEFRADGLPVRLKLSYPGVDLRLAIHDWKASP